MTGKETGLQESSDIYIYINKLKYSNTIIRNVYRHMIHTRFSRIRNEWIRYVEIMLRSIRQFVSR